MFIRYTFHNGEVNLSILDVELILGDVGCEDSELHCLVSFDLIFYEGVGNDWDFNVFGGYDYRGFGVLVGCDRDEVGAVGTEI